VAKLSFPVSQAGLAVPVWIGQDGPTVEALVDAGQQPLPPVHARGLLDTGTDITLVAPQVLRQLALSPSSTTSTHTAAGQVKVQLYRVSLGITDPGQPVKVWLTRPDLEVAELAVVLPDLDVLVGLDVLLECKLLLNGPGRRFMLKF
jgi:hypothetical protein